MDISDETADFLAHYGVKGMHWGIRKDREPGLSRKTDKLAERDAKEYARAKMYYGEGAGTRRKLIKATVDARASKDPAYKAAFDRHYANQDFSKHAEKARGERSRTDKKETTKKGAGYVARRLTGERGTVAAITALAFGGALWLNTPQGQQFVRNQEVRISELIDWGKRRANARDINKFLRGQG